MAAEVRILMLCMGNICRSPTAEAVLRHKLQAAGLGGRIEVDSAGTHGWHAGAPPDERSQRHARRRGYDLSGLRARRLEAADFDRFDQVLAMDDDNIASVRQRFGASRGDAVALLMEFATDARGDRQVPDPYHGGAEGFEDVLDRIEAACDGLVRHWQARLGAGGLPR